MRNPFNLLLGIGVYWAFVMPQLMQTVVNLEIVLYLDNLCHWDICETFYGFVLGYKDVQHFVANESLQEMD